jgi:hypothetical protein
MATRTLKNRSTDRVKALRSDQSVARKSSKRTPAEQAALEAKQRHARALAILAATDWIRGFPVFQGDPVPLKIAIAKDPKMTIPAGAGFSQHHLSVAVGRWVRRPEYQDRLKVGADRFDPYCNKAGIVGSYE